MFGVIFNHFNEKSTPYQDESAMSAYKNSEMT